MFSRISAFLPIAVAVASSARMERHMHVRRDTTPNQCNTGAVKCCNSVTNVGFRCLPIDYHSRLRPRKASDIATVLDLLSYSYDPADSVGIDCTPFNIYGAGEAASCQEQPVCCSNNTYVGLGPSLRPCCVSNFVPDRFHQHRVFPDELQLGIVLL
ncbi:hypothetical protein JVT61DRAFT_7373 [Boletus reticuloceps]|uniref:Hydrophobin n=1 Tax=Boletus reticuloceps TaxID=495285 RepID=A0A8I2YHX0_9AGAM|nr:hypothetical protein JVT61DRAFT_7373 [Boletus reticuloceps]